MKQAGKRQSGASVDEGAGKGRATEQHDDADLLSLISHEIRSPLAAMNFALELLAQTRLDAEEANCLRILRSSSQDIDELLHSMVEMGTIESGAQQWVEASIDVGALVQLVVRSFEPRAAARGFSVLLDWDPALPPGFALRCDAKVIERVLTHLLAYYLHFAATPPEIHLVTKVRDKRADRVILDFVVTMGEKPPLAAHPWSTAGVLAEVTASQGGQRLSINLCHRLLQLGGSALYTMIGSSVPTLSFTLKLKPAA
jgi:signal transduction histidine kinase